MSEQSAEQKAIRSVMPYTLPHPFLTMEPPLLIKEPDRIVLTPMPAPSIKHLEDEMRRLQGQTFSLNFQPSEAFQADMRRFVESMRQVIEVIAERSVNAFRTLVHVLANDPVLSVLVQPTQKPHLSKQSRHYLMVKRRSHRQHFTVPVHRKQRSSRRMQVLERRKARGLNCYGKHPVWEQMGLKLTRTETREFQDFIAWLYLVYGSSGAIDHMHDFKPYDRACKRIDAKIAKRKKYAIYEEETSVMWHSFSIEEPTVHIKALDLQDIINMFRIPPNMLGEISNSNLHGHETREELYRKRLGL